MKYIIYTTSMLAICASFISVGASAQTAPPAAGQEEAATTSSEQSANGGLQDIIVTAQRRSENVQKSSLAISVISADNLVRQGVANARDINSVAPSVTITQFASNVQTNIRGAGDFSTNALGQLAVSYSIDGVVIGQGSQIGGNFYDLARIEVLKGPQGTLYGRNATGGAINLITNRPGREFGGTITAEYGNFDSKRLTGAINVPLSDTLAVRGAFNLVDRDGYLSDGTDDDKRQAGRLQLLWNATPDLSIRLFGDYAHTGGRNGGGVLFPRQPGTGRWTSYTDPRNVAALEAGTTVTVPGLGTFPLQGPINSDDSFLDNKVWSVGAELTYDMGHFATLTVLPAYRHQRFSDIRYTTGFRQVSPDTNRNIQKSLEVRLSHSSDKLKWVLGGFYFDDNSRVNFSTQPITQTATNIFTLFNTTYDLDSYRNKSLAAFGEATYSVTDRFRVIGGLRYTEDKVSIDGIYIDDSPPAIRNPDYILQNRKKFDSVSWRAGVEYDVSPSSMVFFTASKGSKSGGFIVAASQDNQYDPENLTAFTFGTRNRFFGNTLQVNLEAYYWRYRDQQLSGVGFTADGNIAYITRNAGASNPRGVELDVVWQATPNDTLSFNTAYNRARFTKFIRNFPAPLIDVLRVGSNCRVAPTSSVVNGLPVFPVDCSGAPVPQAPEVSGAFNYRHEFNLANDADISFNGGGTFATSRYLNADFFTPETKDKGYVLLNADLTYTTADRRMSITGFVRNITNHAVYQGGFSNVLNGFPALLGTQNTPTFVIRNIGAPRTYGVRATLNF